VTSQSETASAPVVRRADVKDVRFMRDMLHHAFYARETALTGEEEPVYRYVIGWGREGDAGVIALDDGFPVGAAWYRLFSADEPGYGFVDERTPELAIAVVPSRRGRGIGELMLSSLLERARSDGYGQASLSVERQNPALRLYEKHGFRVVREVGNSYTMVAPLDG
jgi:ribosomal protein S18 acetylase RimI-like enzyme